MSKSPGVGSSSLPTLISASGAARRTCGLEAFGASAPRTRRDLVIIALQIAVFGSYAFMQSEASLKTRSRFHTSRILSFIETLVSTLACVPSVLVISVIHILAMVFGGQAEIIRTEVQASFTCANVDMVACMALLSAVAYTFWCVASMNESLHSIKSLSFLLPSSESTGWVFESGWLHRAGLSMRSDGDRTKEQLRVNGFLQERDVWEAFVTKSVDVFSSTILGFAPRKEHVYRFAISFAYFTFLFVLGQQGFNAPGKDD